MANRVIKIPSTSNLRLCFAVLGLCCLMVSNPVLARGVYMTNDEFLVEAFPQQNHSLQKYWLSEVDRENLEAILLRKPSSLRVPYWRAGERSAWVFEEIGKTEPITIGIVVETDKVVAVHILAFRESRGWEVKYPFFRDQFNGVSLQESLQFSTNIDGITGATLSVNAVKKVTAMALYLHQQALQ